MQFTTKIKISILVISLLLSLVALAETPTHDYAMNIWDQKPDFNSSYQARQHAQYIEGFTSALVGTFGMVFSAVIGFFMLRAAWRGLCRWIKRMIRGYDYE